MIMKHCLLCLQKGRPREYTAYLIDLAVDTLIRLEELLTAVNMEHEGHDILGKMFGDVGELCDSGELEILDSTCCDFAYLFC